MIGLELGLARFCGKTNIIGKLYQVNNFYPGFIRNGNNKIWGDVYLIDPSIFDDLDEYEGDEYIRTKIKTTSDVYCWVYEWKGDVSEFKEIKGGDWLLR